VTEASPGIRPLQREVRLLVTALATFLVTLIVALLALTLSILRLDRFSATADAVAAVAASVSPAEAPQTLSKRLDLLLGPNGLSRIEVYRGRSLYAAAGEELPEAELITRPLPNGRLLVYFEVRGWAAGRRAALIVGALATIATMAGLLLLTLYVPKFLRPVEQMLDAAHRVGGSVRTDDDAQFLVQTFREAVERLQEQSREIDRLRDAASSSSPDIVELSRALHGSMSSGFLALDASGVVVGINESGREILRLENDPTGAPVASGVFPPPFADIVAGSFETRLALTRREALLAPDGPLIGLTTVPLFDGERFLGLLALFTDLAGIRAMEGRLRDLEALVGLGQMSAGIAHEFRNALFTILGYLRLAQRDAAPEQAAKIRSAEQEARKLAAAVDALLNFAKPLKLVTQRLSLAAVIRQVVERHAEANRDIAFVTAAPDGAEIEINGDRELLEVAVENVVRNAIEAVRQRHAAGGGRIETTLQAEPRPAVIIRDNGVGFDPERAAGYLLPFQTTKSEGVGLGLPLARKIVLQHGGTLSITGAPNEGAAVTIEFF
jgi:signal transduction histidine kinase